MAAASARRLYMFLGGTFLAGGGLIAAACTTDNGGTTPVPIANDSGRDTGNGSSSGGSSGGSSGTPGDAGADCANAPTPQSSDGVFCFGANVDSGTDASSKTCNSANNEICCSGNPIDGGGFESSECIAATEDTTGYVVGSCNAGTQQEWHCTESSHCPGSGEVCCVMRSDAGAPLAQQDDDFPGCKVYFTSGRFIGGTRCRADDCEAQELQLCSKDSDCANISAGAKCYSTTVSGRYTGVCKL